MVSGTLPKSIHWEDPPERLTKLLCKLKLGKMIAVRCQRRVRPTVFSASPCIPSEDLMHLHNKLTDILRIMEEAFGNFQERPPVAAKAETWLEQFGAHVQVQAKTVRRCMFSKKSYLRWLRCNIFTCWYCLLVFKFASSRFNEAPKDNSIKAGKKRLK